MSTEIKVFNLKNYLTAHANGALITVVAAVALDAFLREMGVNIHPWKEALAAGFGGLFFAVWMVPVLWKLKLFTIRQYLLGATVLVVPTTLIVLAAVAAFDASLFNVFSEPIATGNRGAIAMAIYVRLVRSIILVPIYIGGFYLAYHKWFKHPFTTGL